MLSKGLQPLGFLNPWLYASGFTGLIDITKGSNPGCNTQGFPAVPGWDPVRQTRLVIFFTSDKGLCRSLVSGRLVSALYRKRL